MKDTITNQITVKVKAENAMAGGLVTELKVPVCCRVMVAINVDTKDGLVNSAEGTVTSFIPLPPTEDNEANSFMPSIF